MKVIINKTKHGIFCNGVMLVPGTNCLEAFDDASFDAKTCIDREDIVVSDADKMTAKEQEKAVENANTHATLETLQKKFKNVDTSKQKKKLDDFEKQIKEAGEA